MRPALLRDERGSMLPLMFGFAALALAVVLVATAATSLYLERKRLFTLADGAALAGAEAFEAVRLEGGAVRPRLTSPGVAAAALRYLDGAPRGHLDDLVLARADTPDAASARVTLVARWAPPVLTVFVPEGLRLEVTAHARTVFR